MTQKLFKVTIISFFECSPDVSVFLFYVCLQVKPGRYILKLLPAHQVGFDKLPVEAAIVSYFIDNEMRSRIQSIHDASYGFFPVLPVMKWIRRQYAQVWKICTSFECGVSTICIFKPENLKYHVNHMFGNGRYGKGKQHIAC